MTDAVERSEPGRDARDAGGRWRGPRPAGEMVRPTPSTSPMQLPRTPDDPLDLPAALEAIRAAAERIRPSVRETPTVYSYTFSESAGRDVLLKLENLQRTGSFKVRGALNKILSLDPEKRAQGLIAASAGNHAQGVALAASMQGLRATIVMPEDTPLNKIRRTEEYGAEVLLFGESWDRSQARALELAREHGWTAIHPFDDPDVICGQGTVGLEILAQMPDVETIAVPIGGGGLIAGIALAVKATRPDVRVVGVQAEGAPAMARSFHAGRRVTVDHPRTIADGIRVGAPGRYTFEVVRRLVDDCVTVSEAAITEGVVQTMQKSKVVCETAGVVAVAALIENKLSSGRICAVLSGGNIDLNLLGRLIESGLSSAGFLHPILVRLPDAPGQLQRVLELVAASKANILDVQHYRAGWRVPLGFVDVEILVETRQANQGRELEAHFAELGLDVGAERSSAPEGS